jgi:hypothetical protein
MSSLCAVTYHKRIIIGYNWKKLKGFSIILKHFVTSLIWLFRRGRLLVQAKYISWEIYFWKRIPLPEFLGITRHQKLRCIQIKKSVTFFPIKYNIRTFDTYIKFLNNLQLLKVIQWI